MNQIETTLAHRILPPAGHQPEHPTLIMLHGRGADELDLLGLADYLDDRLLIISARAPFNFEMGGYTWYEMNQVGVPQPGMFEQSYGMLSTFLDDVLGAYPVQKDHCFLLGFSMGTVMSYAIALSRPSLIRGVIAGSGYIPEGTSLQFQWSNLAHQRYFIAHGTDDPVIPVEMARRAKELFGQSTASIMYKEYPIMHQISEEEISDIAGWVMNQIDISKD